MALSFVYGPAGAGKSTYVQDFLVEGSLKYPDRNFFLIVPDQFTMQTQADIVKRHRSGGILNIDVLSFSRLAYRIFEETGAPKELILDDTGKSLVIRHVAFEVEKDMPYIGPNLDKTGFIHEIKSSISEFMQYNISPKDLLNLSEKGERGLFKGKLKDLSVIYDAFVKFNEGKFITGEEQLDILCDKLALSEIIPDSVFVFDGFTGFTPVQEKVILTLLKLCRDVYVTVTVSAPESINETGSPEKLFYLSRTTANRLISKAGAEGIKRGEDVSLCASAHGRFKDSKELTHLEKNLFRYPYEKYDEKCHDIELFKAENIKTEVDEVCLRILKLIREEGYAYRDIAVVTGSLESYADYFERRFKELNIPCFIDKTRGIVLNPFTEFLKSALRIVSGNYSYDAVFHFLRSGFTDFSREEVDRFDNYVRSLNIRGKSAYHKDFTKVQRDRLRNLDKDDSALLDVEKFNDIRKRLIDEMAVLERPAKTVSDHVKNLYEFLRANRSYEKLLKFEDDFEASGDLSKAREYGQVYRLIMDLLDTLVSLIGDYEIKPEEFYRIFDAGITEVTVGTIPANVDRIVVGDIERTRLNEVKALFFTGINDGNIPKNVSRGGILSEPDREVFKEFNFELAPSPSEEMYRQKLYLYMNLCKPSKHLILSLARTDRDGKGIKAAYLVGVLSKMFPGLNAEEITDIPSAERITSLNDSYRHFAGILRKMAVGTADDDEKKLAASLYKVYRENSDDDLYKDMTDSAFKEYVASPLSKEIVKLIYGSVINSSISRMELFAGCAYAHFLKYGMGLKEQADADFNAADLGSVYHAVLDKFALKLEENDLSWADFSDEEGEKFLKDVISDCVNDYGQGMLKEDSRSLYTVVKIEKIMKRTIDTLRFQMKRGKFSQRAHEIPFDRELDLSDGTKLKLNGIVDRVDLYEKDNDIFVKIVDYKSGTRDINISNVYFGLEQQLEVYMSEIIKKEAKNNPGRSVYPAAMLYYRLDNPIVETNDPDKLKKEIYKDLKMTGVVESSDATKEAIDTDYKAESLVAPIKEAKAPKDGEPVKPDRSMLSASELKSMLDYTDRMVRRIGERITGGDISVSPFVNDKKDACQFCRFYGICRFDEDIPGFKSRNEGLLTSEELRERVCGGKGDADYLF